MDKGSAVTVESESHGSLPGKSLKEELFVAEVMLEELFTSLDEAFVDELVDSDEEETAEDDKLENKFLKKLTKNIHIEAHPFRRVRASTVAGASVAIGGTASATASCKKR